MTAILARRPLPAPEAGSDYRADVTTALLTDHYELTMVQAARAAGTADRRSVFELFPRRLPEGRRYGVVAGVGRALAALADFRFDEYDIEYLTRTGVVDDDTADWLADYRFSGSIQGYREGEIYLPGSPLMVVEGTFAEAVILETLLLSIYNHDSAIASAASRMTLMADGRPCAEMGSRRTQEESAVAAARAAWIAGFDATSNLAAGRRWGIPTMGTAAHSFTLLHDSEEDAFRAQLDALGHDTTLLIDTYDVRAAIETAVRLTDGTLGGVRLDSGDLPVVAREVRELLDDLGATHTTITVTSDLDEWQIGALAGAPVDAYGVGTNLVTGSGHPTCGFVYKLVAREGHEPGEMVPVAKRSTNKPSIGGRKFAMRRLDDKGVARAEVIGVGNPPEGDWNDRPLMAELVRDGEIVGTEPIADARARHEKARDELPVRARRMSRGEPVIPTIYLEADGVEFDPLHLDED